MDGVDLNLLGDGATYTALAWITVDRPAPAGLGLLGVCLTLPVILGGAVIGPLLDRFSRRKLFIYDSVFRGIAVALIPLLAHRSAGRDVAALRGGPGLRAAQDHPAGRHARR